LDERLLLRKDLHANLLVREVSSQRVNKKRAGLWIYILTAGHPNQSRLSQDSPDVSGVRLVAGVDTPSVRLAYRAPRGHIRSTRSQRLREGRCRRPWHSGPSVGTTEHEAHIPKSAEGKNGKKQQPGQRPHCNILSEYEQNFLRHVRVIYYDKNDPFCGKPN
jgi:hypothetical protein